MEKEPIGIVKCIVPWRSMTLGPSPRTSPDMNHGRGPFIFLSLSPVSTLENGSSLNICPASLIGRDELLPW